MAVRVVVCPAQIVGLFTVVLGEGLTVIVPVAVLEQPGLDAVTVYVVVLVGDTVIY